MSNVLLSDINKVNNLGRKFSGAVLGQATMYGATR